MTDKIQYAVANKLREFLLDDCLKPKYHGMSAYAIVGTIIEEKEKLENIEMGERMMQDEIENHDCQLESGYREGDCNSPVHQEA